MNLSDKIRSILTGSTISLTAILSDATTLPFVPKFAERFSISRISKTNLGYLQPVAPMDLSIPYSSMKRSVAEVVEGADLITIEVDQMSRLVDGAVENVGRRIDRSRFRLESIKENVLSEKENPSVVFTETFDTYAFTDQNESDAIIRDGALQASVTFLDDIYQTAPSLSLVNTPAKKVVTAGPKISITAVSAGMAVTPIDGIGGGGAVTRTRHQLNKSEQVNTLTVITSTKTKLAHAYGIDDAGVAHEISDAEITRSSSSNTYTLSFPVSVINAVDLISYSENAEVIDKETVKTILEATSPTEAASDIVEQIRAASSAFRQSDKQYSAAYIYGMWMSVIASYGVATDPSKGMRFWQSKPIGIEGDVRTLRLSSMQTTPDGTDIGWSVSVNGSSFIDITPSNSSEIQSERIVFSPDGTARFRFPVKAGTSYSLVEGIYDGSTVRDLVSGSGELERVIGTIVSGPRDSVGSVKYTPETNEELDLTGSGFVPDSPSVVDARTNGDLGEKFVSSSGRKILLTHRPAVAPKVYIGGTLATQLVSGGVDDPSLDRNRYFFSWNGRELKFNREVYGLTVYYSYPVSTLVVRAKLTATPLAKSGASIQSYSMALNNV